MKKEQLLTDEIDMDNLTKEQAHNLCVEMWNEIAENGYDDKIKSEICLKYEPEELCFACHYYSNYAPTECCDSFRTNCPFVKKYGEDGCDFSPSPYSIWYRIDSIENKQHMAIEIADLFIDIEE